MKNILFLLLVAFSIFTFSEVKTQTNTKSKKSTTKAKVKKTKAKVKKTKAKAKTTKAKAKTTKAKAKTTKAKAKTTKAKAKTTKAKAKKTKAKAKITKAEYDDKDEKNSDTKKRKYTKKALSDSYWLSTSGVRHNSTCRWYKKTEGGKLVINKRSGRAGECCGG